MTERQLDYLERLRRLSSHPILVLDVEPGSAEKAGNVRLYASFPGIYLTINPSGRLLDTVIDRSSPKVL
jgi:hypothetical protein